MQTFSATYYSPGQPLGSLAEAYFLGSKLVIAPVDISVNVADITMSVGGFEHDAFFLAWQDEFGGECALKLATKTDIAFVLAHAPPSLQKQCRVWHQRKRRIHLVWSSLAAITGVCVLSVVLLWWHYDQVVCWLVSHITVAQEEQFGKSVLAQMETDEPLISKGPAFEAVQSIGKRLTKNSAYHYQWLIKKEKTVNAFALPGGVIIVHSALLTKIDKPDELAAVLAHEVQHVEQRHALKSMVDNLGWATVLMVFLGDVSTPMAMITHELGGMFFSRDKEDEADRLGLQALINANIAPGGMVTFLQKLEKEPGANPPEWISSHPDTAGRIKTIQDLISAQACKTCQPLVYDWAKVQRDKVLL
ncbi:MAG: M48 family metallopeptidase [Methylococcales bacterium]|nr:M48 family metallopeptidase [Methylococcales bacterium]